MGLILEAIEIKDKDVFDVLYYVLKISTTRGAA